MLTLDRKKLVEAAIEVGQEKLGWDTQDVVGAWSQVLEVSKATVRRWVKGSHLPTEQHATLIAGHMGLSVLDFAEIQVKADPCPACESTAAYAAELERVNGTMAENAEQLTSFHVEAKATIQQLRQELDKARLQHIGDEAKVKDMARELHDATVRAAQLERANEVAMNRANKHEAENIRLINELDRHQKHIDKLEARTWWQVLTGKVS